MNLNVEITLKKSDSRHQVKLKFPALLGVQLPEDKVFHQILFCGYFVDFCFGGMRVAKETDTKKQNKRSINQNHFKFFQ